MKKKPHPGDDAAAHFPPPPETETALPTLSGMLGSQLGTRCPKCSCPQSDVIRTEKLDVVIRRRRECGNRNCRHRWNTIER